MVELMFTDWKVLNRLAAGAKARVYLLKVLLVKGVHYAK